MASRHEQLNIDFGRSKSADEKIHHFQRSGHSESVFSWSRRGGALKSSSMMSAFEILHTRRLRPCSRVGSNSSFGASALPLCCSVRLSLRLRTTMTEEITSLLPPATPLQVTTTRSRSTRSPHSEPSLPFRWEIYKVGALLRLPATWINDGPAGLWSALCWQHHSF